MGFSGPAFNPVERMNERERMVADQIERRGIRDLRVLAAMRKVARHLFVPEEYQGHAYDDEPVPIGQDQTISQPYIVAYMTECLQLSNKDRVLEIGTGSGYQSAILAELAQDVYSVELVESLSGAAQEKFRELNYINIHCRIGNGWKGWPEEAPFDKVIVTAAASEIPEDLIKQLKDGGRMILPVGQQTQELIEGEKRHGILQKTRKIAVRFVPLHKPEEG